MLLQALPKHCCKMVRKIVKSSVADPDPDPPDPHVFGPPGSGLFFYWLLEGQ